MDWTCLGLLSRWQEVCRVYWAIILTISCNLQILALIGFSVLSDCDLDVWSMDLKIHGLNGRSTVYITAKFHRNSLKNNGENVLQQFLEVAYSWPWPLTYIPEVFIRSFPCHGLSTSEMWERTEKSLNMPFQTFLGMMKLVLHRVILLNCHISKTTRPILKIFAAMDSATMVSGYLFHQIYCFVLR